MTNRKGATSASTVWLVCALHHPTAGTTGYQDGLEIPTFQCRKGQPLDCAVFHVILSGPRTRVKHNTPQVRNDQTTESPSGMEAPFLKSQLICVFSRNSLGRIQSVHVRDWLITFHQVVCLGNRTAETLSITGRPLLATPGQRCNGELVLATSRPRTHPAIGCHAPTINALVSRTNLPRTAVSVLARF